MKSKYHHPYSVVQHTAGNGRRVQCSRETDGSVLKHRSPNPQENLLSRPKMSSLWKVCCTYLYLAKGNLEAEAFVEVGVQSVLFDCRLLLLQPLALVLQHHFNEGIWQE